VTPTNPSARPAPGHRPDAGRDLQQLRRRLQLRHRAPESWIERFGESEWEDEFSNERSGQLPHRGLFEMVEDEAEDAEAEDYTVLRYVVEPGWARPSTSR
jgi:hypothetical protein